MGTNTNGVCRELQRRFDAQSRGVQTRNRELERLRTERVHAREEKVEAFFAGLYRAVRAFGHRVAAFPHGIRDRVLAAIPVKTITATLRRADGSIGCIWCDDNVQRKYGQSAVGAALLTGLSAQLRSLIWRKESYYRTCQGNV